MPEDDAIDWGTGPIDTVVLERLARRLRGNARFEAVQARPAYEPTSVVAELDTGYFPTSVRRASVRIRWFETDDFNVHYTEQYRNDESWECRWDRHPTEHNSRAHFHPLPKATTPGEDACYSTDWREVMTMVLSELDARIEAFWE